MGFKDIVNRYKEYEKKELARRAEAKERSSNYKSLARKAALKSRIKGLKPRGKFTKENLTRTIGNPYNVKFPKARKILKKIKKGKKRKRQKVVVIYR